MLIRHAEILSAQQVMVTLVILTGAGPILGASN